jgi:hypothetical protein
LPQKLTELLERNHPITPVTCITVPNLNLSWPCSGLAGNDVVTVGYGKTKLKNPDNPTDAINRRVQVVNMDTKTASK